MTFEEYEQFYEMKMMHDAVLTAASALSTTPDDHTGLSPREAFIKAFDRMSAAQARRVVEEGPRAVAKAAQRAASPVSKLDRQIAGSTAASVDKDELAVAIARATLPAGSPQISSLSSAVRLLLIAQIGISLILKAIQLWLETEKPFVLALKDVGITDEGLLANVAATGVDR